MHVLYLLLGLEYPRRLEPKVVTHRKSNFRAGNIGICLLKKASQDRLFSFITEADQLILI